MKYFGTDGFRGEVSRKLNADYAFKIGRYLGYHFNKNGNSKMIIGKDTRISGDILEHALAAGAASNGVDVYLLGVTPTPVVSFLIRKENYDFGAMISASHNPYQDNGIKIFNNEGFKLEEAVEQKIEDYLDGNDFDAVGYADGDKIGRIINIHEVGLKKYSEWLHDICPFDLSGIKVLADLANGSSTAIAADVLRSYGCEVDVMSNEPNGTNINYNCGSTHLESLCDAMLAGSYDIGIAFDGDADRLLAVDEHGNIVDGDVIMYLCGKYLDEHHRLKDHTIVTTVMSNIGLYKALDKKGLNSKQVAVGDKYVSACMFSDGYQLGGEQSGHIIFGEYAVTGDGLLTAINLINVLKESKMSLEKLASEIKLYPQLLKNVRVNSKQAAMNDEEIKQACNEVNAKLNGNGRLLVRPSGTEELIRVMVEAETDELCLEYVDSICNLIKEKGL